MTLRELLSEAKALGMGLDATVVTFCSCRRLSEVGNVTNNNGVIQINTEGALELRGDTPEVEEEDESDEDELVLERLRKMATMQYMVYGLGALGRGPHFTGGEFGPFDERDNAELCVANLAGRSDCHEAKIAQINRDPEDV